MSQRAGSRLPRPLAGIRAPRQHSRMEPSSRAGHRVALRVLQAGAIAVVLAATPYKTFELDRFFVPKELVLSVTALLATVLILWRAKRLSLARIDELFALWIALGL